MMKNLGLTIKKPVISDDELMSQIEINEGFGFSSVNDSNINDELEPEISRLNELSKIIGNSDFSILFWAPTIGKITALGFNNVNEAAGYLIPQKVKKFINSIPYLQYFISISDDLYKIVQPSRNKYPHLFKGLGFLNTLKQKLSNNDYDIKKKEIGNDSYYYSGIVSYDTIEKTRSFWDGLIKLLLADINTTNNEGIINEGIEILSIRELALNLSETMGGDAYSYFQMLSNAFKHSGDEGLVDMYKQITGITLEPMSRGKYRFV